MSEITIRREEARDAEAVARVTARAFAESAHGHHGEAELVARLRAACPAAISLVGVVDGGGEGRVVGHVLFTPAVIEHASGDRAGMALAPLSVLPEVQRRGIGAQLVRGGLELVRAAGHPFVIVLGDPRYYARFGFTPASRRGLSCKFASADSDAFMALFFADDATGGRARYHPEFG